MKVFTHLCFDERKKIEKWLRKNISLQNIAQALSRSVSSISDEVKNNSVHGIYTAKKAQHKAEVKREKSKRDCLKVCHQEYYRSSIARRNFRTIKIY